MATANSRENTNKTGVSRNISCDPYFYACYFTITMESVGHYEAVQTNRKRNLQYFEKQ